LLRQRILDLWFHGAVTSSITFKFGSRSQRDVTCAKIRKIQQLKFRKPLITWRRMYRELSRSTGQKSRWQRGI